MFSVRIFGALKREPHPPLFPHFPYFFYFIYIFLPIRRGVQRSGGIALCVYSLGFEFNLTPEKKKKEKRRWRGDGIEGKEERTVAFFSFLSPPFLPPPFSSFREEGGIDMLKWRFQIMILSTKAGGGDYNGMIPGGGH